MEIKKAFKGKISVFLKMLSVMLIFAFAASLLAGCKTLPDNIDDINTPTGDGTKSTDLTTAKPANEVFSLGYNSDDTLNPYTLATEYNYRLVTLLYDGLAELSDDMSCSLLIAESIERSENVFTITIKSGAKFSDGKDITAEDVAYSYNLAKNSKLYSPALKNVSSAQPESDRVLKFNVAKVEPNEKAIFTFPIIPKDSEETPASSGRYSFTGGESPKLEQNIRLNHRKFSPKIKMINLVNLADGDAVLVALASGEISFYYNDLASGEVIHTGVPSVSSPQNSLVFLGINSRKTELSNDKVRSALSYGISRQEIASGAFSGLAVAATSPFYPTWADTVGFAGISANENIAVSVAQLSEAGYNSESTLSLELLVPDGNSFKLEAAESLKNQLIKSHVVVKITALSFSDYESRLKSGDFQLYIGEIILPPTLSLDSFLTYGGSAAYGINLSGAAAIAYRGIKPKSSEEAAAGSEGEGTGTAGSKAGEAADSEAKETGTIEEFVKIFHEDSPFIALCYKQGQASFIRSVSGVKPLGYDPFSGFENWDFNIG